MASEIIETIMKLTMSKKLPLTRREIGAVAPPPMDLFALFIGLAAVGSPSFIAVCCRMWPQRLHTDRAVLGKVSATSALWLWLRQNAPNVFQLLCLLKSLGADAITLLFVFKFGINQSYYFDFETVYI